jgi:tRNA(Ser,Leu) C12 N-acetylase TAN1
MKNLIPIEGEKYLFRDLNTNAIINTSKTDYKNYTSLKEQKIKESERIVRIEDEVNQIKNDLAEIKGLLRSILK